MEQRVKVGDKIRTIKPWMTNGRYEKGDVLTVKEVNFAGVYVQENDWYINKNEYEIITDEIKVGDTVTLIDKPWEHPLWATFDRKRRRAYSEMTGKVIRVRDVYWSPALVELRGIPCASTGTWFLPLAILRKVEPLEAKHRYTDEQIKEAKCYLAERMLDCDCWTITKPTEAHPVAVVSGPLGTGTAKCAPDDEFNVYIGLMVAFKRYHGEPLPTWIRG